MKQQNEESVENVTFMDELESLTNFIDNSVNLTRLFYGILLLILSTNIVFAIIYLNLLIVIIPGVVIIIIVLTFVISADAHKMNKREEKLSAERKFFSDHIENRMVYSIHHSDRNEEIKQMKNIVNSLYLFNDTNIKIKNYIMTIDNVSYRMTKSDKDGHYKLDIIINDLFGSFEKFSYSDIKFELEKDHHLYNEVNQILYT